MRHLIALYFRSFRNPLIRSAAAANLKIMSTFDVQWPHCPWIHAYPRHRFDVRVLPDKQQLLMPVPDGPIINGMIIFEIKLFS